MAQRPGWDQHDAAVERLRASLAALPADAPVRLTKPTSNLFRPRSRSTAGLDVSGLTGVIELDPTARLADVQGMCTYEHLVDATLPHGLIPLVVPQLRTITLGGAVTGLGIESTSFRNGFPHESVVEMDVLTGSGVVVTTRPGEDLFDAFPNSYGSLGYATRLRIRLEEVPRHVALRHLRFDDAAMLAKTTAEIVETGRYDGVQVHGLDGVGFAPDELYLTLARWDDEPGGAHSDYTGDAIYYRSLQQRETDRLTTYDYLWPRRWRRSDVYHRLVRLDQRFHIADRLDRRAGRPQREAVIQDVEVPVERLPEFLAWFDERVGMRPVWLCPVVATRDWPCYPLEPGVTYVNIGFWGTVHVGPEAADAPLNRAIESKLLELGGHKSLYSEAFYDRETFDRLYDGPNLARVKAVHDPDGRLTTLYDKAVRRQ